MTVTVEIFLETNYHRIVKASIFGQGFQWIIRSLLNKMKAVCAKILLKVVIHRKLLLQHCERLQFYVRDVEDIERMLQR